MTAKPCKDCRRDYEELKSSQTGIVGMGEPPEPKWRPAPYPGPRCATHSRAFKKSRSKAAHEKRVQAVYGLAPGEYDKLYDFQGGRCFICQRANGKSRRLSVDHDHKTGAVRGLLCRPCNDLLGHLRDDPEAFERGKSYLLEPPKRRMFHRGLTPSPI